MTKTIARRFTYVMLATAALGAGALLGSTGTMSVEPVSAETVSAETVASDAGGAETTETEQHVTPIRGKEDAPKQEETAPETAEDDGQDVPEVEVLDPAEQEDLPEVEVLEGDVMGEDYIPIEGDEEEVTPEDEFGPAPEDAMWSTDPDAVNVSITYGESGEVVHVDLTDSEGNDVPTGSIAESWPDDNTDAEG